MSLEMLNRILYKCTSEARVITMQMHFTNEPFLIPHFPEMIRMAHQYGIPVLVSTNLNVNIDRVARALSYGPRKFMISVSGWTQEIYERSHRGGDIERVKRNMKIVAGCRSDKTNVQVSWHQYRYNAHEQQQMKEYALSLGFSFLPYTTTLLSPMKAMEIWRTGATPEYAGDLLISPLEARMMCYKRRKWDCTVQDRILILNSEGTLFRCGGDDLTLCNSYGSLFDTTVNDFLVLRRKSLVCKKCKSVGCHIYCLQSYMRPQWSPMRLAGTLCRRLGIANYVEPYIRKFYGHKLLPSA